MLEILAICTMAVVVAGGVVGVVMLNRSRRQVAQLRDELLHAQQHEAAETADRINRLSTDLAERWVKTSGDMRQDLSDRMTRGLGDVQTIVGKQLYEGRQEQATTAQKSSEAMERRYAELYKTIEHRLETLRTQVDQKLAQIMQSVQTKLDQNIKEGFKHFEAVQKHLKEAEEQLRGVGEVGQSINQLNTLLKLPHLRGGFGELTLESLLSDFLPQGTYEMQAEVVPGSRERVDALVLFPNARLPIDSKFPREQVLPLFETNDAQQLTEARKTLDSVVRSLARSISDKYIHPEHGTMDMALLYLPSETLYFEVIRDGQLWEYVAKRKVFPVSPNTLSITLKSVAIAHDYYQMAKDVEATLQRLQLTMKHLEHFQDRFEDVGKGLDRAQRAYQTASTHLGNYTSRVEQLAGEEEDGNVPPGLLSQDEQ